MKIVVHFENEQECKDRGAERMSADLAYYRAGTTANILKNRDGLIGWVNEEQLQTEIEKNLQ